MHIIINARMDTKIISEEISTTHRDSVMSTIYLSPGTILVSKSVTNIVFTDTVSSTPP